MRIWSGRGLMAMRGSRASLVRTAIAAFIAVTSLGVVWPAPAPVHNAPGIRPALEDALRRGELTLGVDHVPPPIGPADYETRRSEGYEQLVAADLASSLGVKVELVSVDPGERSAALRERRADLLLVAVAENATADDFQIIPAGHATALAALMRSDAPVTSWSALRNRVVCVADGNAPARHLADALGATARVLKAPAKSLAQMRTGDCAAAIHDEVQLRELVRQPDWAKFSAVLPASHRERLVFAVERGDLSSAALLRGIAERWARSGIWAAWTAQWAADVAFEVYLEQDAPDCH